MSNRFLQNKSFIQWRLFPSEEDHMYWNTFTNDHPDLVNEINEAIRIIKSIKLNTQKLSPEEKQEIFNLIQKDIRERNKKKRYPLYWTISAVACVALILVLLRIFVSVDDEVIFPEQQVVVQDSIVNPGEIQLILADNKAITIENESDIIYNKQGEIIINASEEKIKMQEPGSEEMSLKAFNTLIVPKGRRSNLTLPDGTKVWINSGTTLKFPPEFETEKREVWIDGEMYIEVSRNDYQPFFVHTSHMTVNVVGTRFNVSAYQEDETSSVVLVEGGVDVIVRDEKFRLLPDQMLTMVENMISTQTVNVYDYISWKDGLLQFSGEPLTNILNRLSRYYDMDIACEERVKGLKCSGKLVLFDDIEEVLETIYNTIPIKYTINEEHIMISKR